MLAKFLSLYTLILVNIIGAFVPEKNLLAPASGRIIGGQVAEPHSFPYQVYMDLSGAGIWQCSGSLISPNYILTSGSCAVYAEEAIVYLGITNIKEPESTVVRMRSTEITVHPDYSVEYGDNIGNVGLVKLPEPVVLSENIQIIPLPSKNDINIIKLVNETATVSGWGYTEDDVISGPLLYTNILIISTEECLDIFGDYYVANDTICANAIDGNRPCGDRGSPLVFDGKLIGVFGFSIEGCYASYPVAFQSVQFALDWIEEHTDVTISR